MKIKSGIRTKIRIEFNSIRRITPVGRSRGPGRLNRHKKNRDQGFRSLTPIVFGQ